MATEHAFVSLINSIVLQYTLIAGAFNTEKLLGCLDELISFNKENLSNIQVKGSLKRFEASFRCNCNIKLKCVSL